MAHGIRDGNCALCQTPTLSPGALTDTSNYVLQYTNTNGCGTVLSNQVQFDVLPDLQTASVQGWDGLTLCYNDPITLTLEGVDDHPWLSHQWFQSNASGVEELVAFESLTASNHPVNESSQFYVLTTSNFGCGSVELPAVDVWENLEPPTIGRLTGFGSMTLCFLDSAPDFTTVGLASGGGGPLVYEWNPKWVCPTPISLLAQTIWRCTTQVRFLTRPVSDFV